MQLLDITIQSAFCWEYYHDIVSSVAYYNCILGCDFYH
jgi:hypothetical protein